MEHLDEIGARLRGLREVLNISAEKAAEVCGTTLEHYLKIEAGQADPGVYRLSRMSRYYGISLDTLLFGEEPRMKSYFVTRAGQGPKVERNLNYNYQSLAYGFRGRKMDPFLTTVEPLPGNETFSKNAHDGQEFSYIIEGQLEITIDNKVHVLSPGDTIYFDASRAHCMRALNGAPCRFLTIIC